MTRPRKATAQRGPAIPGRYQLCLGCYRHVRPKTKGCPFCGADVAKLARDEARRLKQIEQLSAKLSAWMERARA